MFNFSEMSEIMNQSPMEGGEGSSAPEVASVNKRVTSNKKGFHPITTGGKGVAKNKHKVIIKIVIQGVSKQADKSIVLKHNKILGTVNHGHLVRTAYKLSATKIEHSHWSTGHSTHL